MSKITSLEIYGSVMPYPVVKAITLEGTPEDSKETLDVVIRDIIPESVPGTWGPSFMQNELSQFIQFAVVRSTNVSDTLLWSTKPDVLYNNLVSPFWTAYNVIRQPGLEFQTSQIFKYGIKPSISNPHSNSLININSDKVIEYPLEIPKFDKLELSSGHLSYFFLSYFDFDAMSDKYDISIEDIINSIPIREQYEISHIVALDGGKIASLVNKFFKQDGTEWSGPVFKEADSWFGGKEPGQEIIVPLELIKTTQNIVRDFRSGTINYDINKNIFSYRTDLDELLGKIKITPNPALTFQNRGSVIDDIISYAEPTKDILNNQTLVSQCGIFFTLDMGAILRQNSAFPGLYKEGDSTFPGLAVIKNMIVKKHRVKKTQDYNIAGLPIDSFEPMVDVSPVRVGYFNDSASSKFEIKEKKIFLEENTSPSGTKKSYRHFECEDTVITGIYKYFIELEVEDPAVKYFSTRLNGLFELIKEIKLYYYEASQPYLGASGQVKTNFNIYSGRFTDEYKSKKMTGGPESGVDLHSGGTIRTKIKTDLLEIVEKLINEETTEFGGTGAAKVSISGKKFRDNLYKMLATESATPDSILKAIEIVQIIIDKVSKLAGVTNYDFYDEGIGAKNKNQDILDPANPIGHSKPTKMLFKIMIPLQSTLEINNNLDVGYDYISSATALTRPAKSGLKSVKFMNFLKRGQEENNKYFTTENMSTKIIFPGSSLGRNIITFLTPSSVRLGNFRVDSLKEALPLGISAVDKEKYRNIILKCVEYNLNNKYFTVKDTVPSSKEAILETYEEKKMLGSILSSTGLFLEELTTDIEEFSEVEENLLNDVDNILEDTHKEIGKTEYNGENIYFLSTKNPNTLFMNLLGLFSNNSREPMEFYDWRNLKFSIGENFPTINHDNMKHTKKHIYQEIINDLFETGMPMSTLATKVRETFVNLPTQIKSLFREAKDVNSSSADQIVKKTGFFDNSIKDPKLYLYDYAVYWMHYENLVEVQYLAGYKKTQLRAPIWKKLDVNHMQEPKFSNQDILCRVKKYENKIADIRRPEMLELPIYNEYFILSKKT